MTKPTLYHDIDGVLFGDYAGEFQLRPGVKTWLYWVQEHFKLVWLTTWEPDEIRTLLSVLYCGKFVYSLESPAFQVADWYAFANKAEWLAYSTHGLEWFWIDDDRPSDEKLNALRLDPFRCLRVNPQGADELEVLKLRLQSLQRPSKFDDKILQPLR